MPLLCILFLMQWNLTTADFTATLASPEDKVTHQNNKNLAISNTKRTRALSDVALNSNKPNRTSKMFYSVCLFVRIAVSTYGTVNPSLEKKFETSLRYSSEIDYSLILSNLVHRSYVLYPQSIMEESSSTHSRTYTDSESYKSISHQHISLQAGSYLSQTT